MSDAPHYSLEPRFDEQRIGIAAQNPNEPGHSFGTLRQQDNGITVALKNQQEGARCATYGRNAVIAGELSLSTTHNVTSIVVKLEGTMKAGLGSMVMPEVKVLELSSTLWEAGGASSCPNSLPFAMKIPGTFNGPSNTTLPLPPSYSSLGGSVSLQGLNVQCVYRLTALLVRPRWMPNKSLAVDIEYAPRTVPPRPVMDAPFPFFDTIKSAPEEWRQVSTVVPVKSPGTFKPIHCDLFTPSVNIFARRDTVPFFVQLRGTSAAILALHGHGAAEPGLARRLLRVTSSTSSPAAPKITVSVKRQVTALFDGLETGYSHIIGSSSLRPVPPGYAPPGAQDVLTVDYEGEIRFDISVAVGGFDAGVIKVTDFFAFSVQPMGGAKNHFVDFSQSHPVRVVSG